MSGATVSGACNTLTIQSSPTNTSAFITSAMTPISRKDRNKLFFSRSISRFPNCMAKNALLPIHNPNRIEVRNTISVYAEPTAASASAPKNRPTISVSATLYNCCNRLPIISGSAKSKSRQVMLPLVKSSDTAPFPLSHFDYPNRIKRKRQPSTALLNQRLKKTTVG